jgi:hypothetical protein
MPTTQNAQLTIAYVPFSAPPGSVVDHVTVAATASNPANNPPAQSVPGDTTSVTFTNLTPDTYTFVVQAFPQSGPGFGSPVQATLVITGTSVTLQIPGTLDATQP